MKLLSSNELYNVRLTQQRYCLLDIDLSRTFERLTMNKFSRLNKDEELLKILQTFNENIIGVNTKLQQYTVKWDFFNQTKKEPTILGITQLSTGEKLFAICLMAHETKTKIIVCREIAQLDMPHLKLLFKFWHDSDYIDIIIPNRLIEPILNYLYQHNIRPTGGEASVDNVYRA